MSETGESSDEPERARVLVDIPEDVVRALDEIIKLVHPEFQAVVADVLQLVPQDLLALITESKRDSTVRILEYIDKTSGHTKHVRYASWVRRRLLIPTCLKGKEWQEIMGELRDQEDHDVCWAIVVSELIRAMRIIDGRQTDRNIRYSPQDLVDFADKEQRRIKKKAVHYCYPLNLTKGMEYVVENGIQREEDRPFEGCPEHVAERKSSEFAYIEKFVRIRSLEDALLQLTHHPVGAGLAMFQPEYRNIGEKIYRGPVNRYSRFVGLHAISLMAVYEENGEKYVLGRASHGDDFGVKGYIKISLEAMLLYIPTPGEAIDEKFSKYFSKPGPLLSRFSYPKLLSPKAEEAKRVKHAKQRHG